MAPGAPGGGGWDGLSCPAGSLCPVTGAPLLPSPLFASTGQVGDLSKSSQLSLVQGAELAPGLRWSWDRPPFQPLAGAGDYRRPPPHFQGLWEISLPLSRRLGSACPGRLPLPRPLPAPGGSCGHTALGMPCQPSVAVTLQCPCNDTDSKTGCPSQSKSKMFPGSQAEAWGGSRLG